MKLTSNIKQEHYQLLIKPNLGKAGLNFFFITSVKAIIMTSPAGQNRNKLFQLVFKIQGKQPLVLSFALYEVIEGVNATNCVQIASE